MFLLCSPEPSYAATMHPPQFSTSQKLSDWPECRLEVRCTCSEWSVLYPVRMLIEQHGDQTFDDLLLKLRCSKCRRRSGSVHLIAGQARRVEPGRLPSWSVELTTPSVA